MALRIILRLLRKSCNARNSSQALRGIRKKENLRKEERRGTRGTAGATKMPGAEAPCASNLKPQSLHACFPVYDVYLTLGMKTVSREQSRFQKRKGIVPLSFAGQIQIFWAVWLVPKIAEIFGSTGTRKITHTMGFWWTWSEEGGPEIGSWLGRCIFGIAFSGIRR